MVKCDNLCGCEDPWDEKHEAPGATCWHSDEVAEMIRDTLRFFEPIMDRNPAMTLAEACAQVTIYDVTGEQANELVRAMRDATDRDLEGETEADSESLVEVARWHGATRPFALRLPYQLFEELNLMAQVALRSVNAVIVEMLQRKLDEDRAKQRAADVTRERR
jgi:hypothetical protein